jgi:transketolase
MTENVYEKDVRDAFFDKVYDLALKDKDVIFITADAGAFSLQRFKKDFPERFINVGVAEQTMVLLAAGLAMCGKNVFVYSIIPFITQRALEHIKVNICSMNLPVTIVGCGAGLSFGFDGPTHHGNQDIAAMKSLPEMKIFSPSDAMSSMMSAEESYLSKTPTYVRLDKGRFSQVYTDKDVFSKGIKVLSKPARNNIISTGFMTNRALEVSRNLSKLGIDVGVIDVGIIKPLNKDVILDIIKDSDKVFVLEEHSVVGGLGTSISDILSDSSVTVDFKRLGLPDQQIFEYGDREWLLDFYNLSVEKISNSIYSNLLLESNKEGKIV